MKDTIYRQAAIDAVYSSSVGRQMLKGHKLLIEILKCLPSAQPEQHWIPCSERLPEVNVLVLVTLQPFNGEINVIIAKVVKGYFSKRLEWESDDGECAYDIECGFAWMPLPEPYRAERRTDGEIH